MMHNQRQFLGRQQIPVPHPPKNVSNQNQYIPNQVEEQNMYQQFPNQKIYRQQHTPNRQHPNQQFNYNPPLHQMQEQQLYQGVPSYSNNQKIISQQSSINPQIENKQMQQQKYNVSQYKINQDSANNQIIHEQKYQPKLQMEGNIEKKQLMQHSIHNVIKKPKEEEGLVVEGNSEQVKHKTYEILNNNENLTRIKEELYQQNNLQQSNGSDIRQPGEQLSMIEVNEDLRSKLR